MKFIIRFQNNWIGLSNDFTQYMFFLEFYFSRQPVLRSVRMNGFIQDLKLYRGNCFSCFCLRKKVYNVITSRCFIIL